MSPFTWMRWIGYQRYQGIGFISQPGLYTRYSTEMEQKYSLIVLPLEGKL